MWRYGKHEARLRAKKRDTQLWMTGVRDEEGKDIAILTKNAGEYLTEEFFTCYYVWVQSENLECLPFLGGWAEQPEWIVDAIRILKGERATVDAQEKDRDKQVKSHKLKK